MIEARTAYALVTAARMVRKSAKAAGRLDRGP
jgi:hypothetical protein